MMMMRSSAPTPMYIGLLSVGVAELVSPNTDINAQQ